MNGSANFGRRDHHLVPGTVTIDRAPYVCDVDKETFHDRDAFTAHLRTSHNVAPAKILDSLIIRDGQVHFGGR